MEEMNRENARKIDFHGFTLEECVNALLKFQNRGESVYVNFNGHQLYSCDVTMDSAYQEITGKTKAELDKAKEEWRRENEEREAREEAEAIAKIPEWIEKGKSLIYPERVEEWEKLVEKSAKGLYHGSELENAIEIMEKLESGATLDEAKELLDTQNKLGMGYIGKRNIIFLYSKRGPEFFEYTADGEISPENRQIIEDKKKENKELEELYAEREDGKQEKVEDEYAEQRDSAVEVKFQWKYGSSLDSAVKELEEYKARGESVVMDFNGHKLYSCDITMDGAYQEVLGKTKAEVDRARQEYMENLKKRQAEERAAAEEKIPYWMEKGSDLIYPERMEDWKKYVEVSARKGMYNGMDIDATIELMEMLENGSLEDAKKLIHEQGHSGWSYGIVRENIFEFSSKGPEFWEYTAKGEIDAETRKALDEKKKENAELNELHKDDSTKEVSIERRKEEQEIIENLDEKNQLTQEIGDIEKQIEALREIEAKLKKELEDKQTQLNGLEEK